MKNVRTRSLSLLFSFVSSFVVYLNASALVAEPAFSIPRAKPNLVSAVEANVKLLPCRD